MEDLDPDSYDADKLLSCDPNEPALPMLEEPTCPERPTRESRPREAVQSKHGI